MAYSSIKKKKCKFNGCTRWPNISMGGYCWEHSSEELKAKVGSQKALQLKNRNARNSTASRIRKVQREVNGDSEKVLWYLARRHEMTGICQEPGCGKSTNKDNDKYFTWSICHIVPKSLVPSVAYNFLNWIELCQQHHEEFDNTFNRAAAMKIFPEAKRKFNLFKCLIPNEELRKVNPHLLT